MPLVNRMGFNNDGVEKIIQRIQNLYPKKDRVNPLGINIGKSKETPLENAHEDYIFCLKRVLKKLTTLPLTSVLLIQKFKGFT